MNGEDEHPVTSLPQQQGKEGAIAAGADDPSYRYGIDISSSGMTRKGPGTLSGGGGSGRGESNTVKGRGGGGRGAKGRWVATMMVPGRKLWDSSPAMMSQYKRFRRSRQDPKIARDQVRVHK